MITYNNERHKQLVKRNLDLKNQGTTLYDENPNEFSELLRYEGVVVEEVYWPYRDKFVKIIKNLLTNNITFNEFEETFLVLYTKVRKESELFVQDLEKIENFEPSTRPYPLARLMHVFYRLFEEIHDEYMTEQEVINSIRDRCLRAKIFKDELDIWT